jgi:hypothetical protein
MAQKPVLRGEVGARALRVRLVSVRPVRIPVRCQAVPYGARAAPARFPCGALTAPVRRPYDAGSVVLSARPVVSVRCPVHPGRAVRPPSAHDPTRELLLANARLLLKLRALSPTGGNSLGSS